ncbi:hypothetical protein GUJ93_ZPchr0010g10392 [Zizania palustris]|uniref:Glycoside hydrolase family 13 N-terminal domain-containing protein n=1 Tax=Zizania palustris TaxID=103762 RepID=A0A8J6BLA6_ZIZPA|nr:hypothetical protein GUJ93_ZPchr0010g10392 [Zizania palustris]
MVEAAGSGGGGGGGGADAARRRWRLEDEGCDLRATNTEYVRLFHHHEPCSDQCSSAVAKHIKAPVHLRLRDWQSRAMPVAEGLIAGGGARWWGGTRARWRRRGSGPGGGGGARRRWRGARAGRGAWGLAKGRRAPPVEGLEGPAVEGSGGRRMVTWRRRQSAEGVTYCEWAPRAHSAALVGDFNNWNLNANRMSKNEFGVWEIFLPNNADGSSPIPHGSRVKVRMETPSGIKDSIPAWIKYFVQAPGEISYNIMEYIMIP